MTLNMKSKVRGALLIWLAAALGCAAIEHPRVVSTGTAGQKMIHSGAPAGEQDTAGRPDDEEKFRVAGETCKDRRAKTLKQKKQNPFARAAQSLSPFYSFSLFHSLF